MKDKGGFTIHFTNRWLYTFIALGILAVIGVGVYAVTYTSSGAGHPYTELSTCAEGQILRVVGGVWTCVDFTDAKAWAKTDNPTIPGNVTITEKLKAQTLKETGYVTQGGACSVSQEGELALCYYSIAGNQYTWICMCIGTASQAAWYKLAYI